VIPLYRDDAVKPGRMAHMFATTGQQEDFEDHLHGLRDMRGLGNLRYVA
jgi:hypothetical protein